MKKRNSMNLGKSFLSALIIMAFMFMGAQQASAQYLHADEALTVVSQKVTELQATPATAQVGAISDATVSTDVEAVYYAGIAVALKEGSGVQAAINSNHNGFLDRFPMLTTKAAAMKADAETLLAE